MSIDYGYKNFGIMFLGKDLSSRESFGISSKIRKFDRQIALFIDKKRDEFYDELEKLGYKNNMGVIQRKD
jgi:hypothetical protein